MKNKKRISLILYYVLLIASVVYFFNQILFNYTLGDNLESFPDSNDYKFQSEQPFFSKNFFFPQPTQYFSPRPFTIPLIYKIVGSDAHRIVVVQKIIYCISVLLLLFSLLSFLDHYFTKTISTILLLYFFTWWNIIGWSNIILSESLSLSFLFLWIATLLFYYKKQSKIIFAFLLVVSLLFSFTRDTWPYIILFFAIINTLVFLLFKKTGFKMALVYLVFSFLFLIIQNITSSIGQRYKLPLFHSIIGRVTQNQNYINWFEKEGMPLADIIVNDFKGKLIDEDYHAREYVYSKYNDSTYKPLFNWILKDGKFVYQKFLLLHPTYFFLNDQSPKQLKKIYCTTLLEYIQQPNGFYLKADATFPYFKPNSLILILSILFFILLKKRKLILIFPFILTFLCIINALISYNADALEVERHLFNTQIMIDLIGLFSVILLMNELSIYIINKYFNENIKPSSAYYN